MPNFIMSPLLSYHSCFAVIVVSFSHY